MDEDGKSEVGGESGGCDAAEADAEVDPTEGGTRAASICSVPFWNSMWPNTQSINRLQRVSQLCPSTSTQEESSRVTKNVSEVTLPVENWMLSFVASVTKVFNEPSRSWSSSGVIA